MRLRHSVRGVVVDESDRMLLCRIATSSTTVVWAAPGGGIEPGESRLDALRRELSEEVGLDLDGEPPHVWRQQVLGPQYLAGYDGVVNDYFLVRTESFEPRGTMSSAELAAENISGARWWSLAEIRDYPGPDLVSPRDLATPLSALLADGPPAHPVALGL